MAAVGFELMADPVVGGEKRAGEAFTRGSLFVDLVGSV
jgi:hypothetical protein